MRKSFYQPYCRKCEAKRHLNLPLKRRLCDECMDVMSVWKLADQAARAMFITGWIGYPEDEGLCQNR